MTATLDSSPPAATDLRLRLEPPRSPVTFLDGAWWPRSGDPLAELPALIRAIQASRGHLGHVMLPAAGWDSTPSRLTVDGRLVRVAWFTSGPAGLLTTICHNRSRVDLLVLPPETTAAAAKTAMTMAADPANALRAPEILAAIS